MWVPSDLESDSEDEFEEGAKRKKTEDEEDSGGEYLIGRFSVVLFFPLRDKLQENVSKSKGVVYMIPGHFCSGVSPLRFSRMAMYSFTCEHEFTPVTMSEREFLFCREISQRYHIHEE